MSARCRCTAEEPPLYPREVVQEALAHLYDTPCYNRASGHSVNEAGEPFTTLDFVETRLDVVDALNRLRPDDRELLVYRAQGYTQAEAVQQVTGARLPDKTVQKRCERAFNRLVSEMNGGRDWVEGLTAQRNLLDAIQEGLAAAVYPPLPSPPRPPVVPLWQRVPDWWEPFFPPDLVVLGPPPLTPEEQAAAAGSPPAWWKDELEATT